MEVTVNIKQASALVWTLIAVALSLIVVLAMGFDYSMMPWWVIIAAFFAVFLVITLPVYLLIALWSIVAKPEAE
jgi:hypothetical protein